MIFIGCYAAMTLIPPGYAMLALIVIAHLASNVVYALGLYAVLNHFSAQMVSLAAARAYRWSALLAGTMSLAAGLLGDSLGAAASLYLLSGGSLLLTAVWLCCTNKSGRQRYR